MLDIKDHPRTNGSLSHTQSEGTENRNGSPFHVISVQLQDGLGTCAPSLGEQRQWPGPVAPTSASRLTVSPRWGEPACGGRRPTPRCASAGAQKQEHPRAGAARAALRRGPRAQPGDLGLSRRMGAADAASLLAPGPRSPDQPPGAHPTAARRTASQEGQPQARKANRALPLWRSPRGQGAAPAVLTHLSPFRVKAVHELIYLHVLFNL